MYKAHFDKCSQNLCPLDLELHLRSGNTSDKCRWMREPKQIKLDGKEIDFRVSVLPTVFGNKVVMRALDKSNLSIGLDSLGFLPWVLDDFKQALKNPESRRTFGIFC